MALFAPIKVGNVELKHRIVMSPMTRTRNDPVTEAPREINKIYYDQRSKVPGTLIISEASHTSRGGRGYLRAGNIYNKEHIKGCKLVTKAVHDNKSSIYCQLFHCGRVSHPSLTGGEIVAPSPIKMKGEIHIQGGKAPYGAPTELTKEGIKKIVEEFRVAARNAMEAGYDGIEIHGGNGYLIQQFLATNTNLRKDDYGGSVENRARFLLELVDACSSEIGKDRVAVKLQPGVTFSDLIESESDVIPMLKFLGPQLSDRKLSYVCYSSLNGEPYFRFIGLDKPHFSGDIFKTFRKLYKGTLMINGGIQPDQAEQYVKEGTADLICFGVLWLANANLPDLIKHKKPLNMGGSDTSMWYGKDPASDEKFYIDWPLEKV